MGLNRGASRNIGDAENRDHADGGGNKNETATELFAISKRILDELPRCPGEQQRECNQRQEVARFRIVQLRDSEERENRLVPKVGAIRDQADANEWLDR